MPKENGSRQSRPPRQAGTPPPPPPGGRKKVDPKELNLRRTRPTGQDVIPEPAPVAVSAGPIDKVIDLAFNPTRDKIREVTIIDRLQGRLFPIMDAMNSLYRNCIEVATYRYSKEVYEQMFRKARPDQLDIMDELMFRVAQWQKSVAGKNLEKATDIALAETETRAAEGEEPIASGRGYED